MLTPYFLSFPSELKGKKKVFPSAFWGYLFVTQAEHGAPANLKIFPNVSKHRIHIGTVSHSSQKIEKTPNFPQDWGNQDSMYILQAF